MFLFFDLNFLRRHLNYLFKFISNLLLGEHHLRVIVAFGIHYLYRLILLEQYTGFEVQLGLRLRKSVCLLGLLELISDHDYLAFELVDLFIFPFNFEFMLLGEIVIFIGKYFEFLLQLGVFLVEIS